MNVQIKTYVKKYDEATHSYQTVRGTVDVMIDIDAIALRAGKSALQNSSERCRLLKGCVRAKVLLKYVGGAA